MVKYYNNGSGRGSVWLERDVRDVEVAGSNPVAPTKIKENKNDKRERNIKLLELQKRISLDENTKMIGKKVDVLVEGASKSDPDRLSGRTRQNHIVVFNGSQDLVGKLVGVVIHEGTGLTLFGKSTSCL